MFSLPVPVNVHHISYKDMTLLQAKKPKDPSMGVYRSVITCEERVLCVAPPRSIPFDEFVSRYPIENVQVDEFVDGTMVNVFFKDTWVLSTKSCIGANNHFLEGSPSFAEMFMDAANVMGLNMNTLDKTMCYSFVLQHPKNRIVAPIKTPFLILVKCYLIREKDVAETVVNLPLPRPRQMCASSYDEVKSWAKIVPFHVKGYMLHAWDGTRSKVMGEKYLEVSQLRGSGTSMKMRLLELWNKPELHAFRGLYPEAPFGEVNGLVRRFTNDLYTMYLECFRENSKKLKEYPREFRPHMYALHQLYLSSWPTPIHKKRVVEYVSKMSAVQLSAALKI